MVTNVYERHKKCQSAHAWRDVMKWCLALGAGLLAGTMIGAAAVTGLHAQAKPSVFVITEIDISDPEGYGNEFVPKAQAIKAAGAKFLAIGGVGAGARPITSLEGTPPKRVTIQQWDSLRLGTMAKTIKRR